MISWRMVVNQYTLFCLLAVALVIGVYSMRKYGDMRFNQGVELTERKHQLATLERDKAERAKEKLAQDKVDELKEGMKMNVPKPRLLLLACVIMLTASAQQSRPSRKSIARSHQNHQWH